MTRHLVIGCIVVFWLTMMGLLVKREVVPAWVTARRPTYRTAAVEEDLPRRTQLGIYLKTQRVGTSRSITRRDTDGSLVIEGTVVVEARVPLLHVRSRLDVASRVRVGPDGRLRRFRIDAKAPGIERIMQGEVVGSDLIVTSRTGRHTETRTIPFEPRDALAHDLCAMEGLGDLHVGRRWFIQNLNPLTGRHTPGMVEVRRREIIAWRGERVETFLVVSRAGAMEVRAWVRPDGEVLRQELPIGLTLEREPFEEPLPAATRPGSRQGRTRS